MTDTGMLRHVLWINEIAAPVGGCETYLIDTARHLRARGIRGTLLYDPGRPTHTPFLQCFDAAFPLVDPATQIRALAPDVVYVHRLTGTTPARAVAAGGVPVVRFFHDHRLFCLREHKYTALLHRTCSKPLGTSCLVCPGFIRRTERWPHVGYASLPALRRELDANRAFQAFVVGSSYMAQHLALHGFEPARIHVAPLGVNPPPDHRLERREADLVVFLGQLVRGKGVDVLLDALARMRGPARLELVGTGRQERELRERAHRLGISQRVRFEGAKDAASKTSYLRRASVVAVPSRAPETFALVGPEAMSCGTPVVASRVGGMSEWLQDEVTGLAVPPNDPGALARALERILSEPGLAPRLGAAGRRAYLERFTPGHHLDRLLQVLTRTASAEVV